MLDALNDSDVGLSEGDDDSETQSESSESGDEITAPADVPQPDPAVTHRWRKKSRYGSIVIGLVA